MLKPSLVSPVTLKLGAYLTLLAGADTAGLVCATSKVLPSGLRGQAKDGAHTMAGKAYMVGKTACVTERRVVCGQTHRDLQCFAAPEPSIQPRSPVHRDSGLTACVTCSLLGGFPICMDVDKVL